MTIWRIEAPMEDVYAVILDSLHWPDWWPSVKKVRQIAPGDANGIDSIRRYSWQGKLPYRVVFDVCATRIDELAAIEGNACGDLDGVGRWKFTRKGAVSVVHYEWHVHSTRWWMNLVAPLARTYFIRNHAQIMEQGGRSLARLLKAPLIGQEHIDLTSATIAPRNGHRLRQGAGERGS